MTPSIAGEVRGDDVVKRVATTVLARPQMLSCAPQLARLAGRHAVFGSEGGRVVKPHWLLAVVAASVLPNEGGGTKTSEGSCAHGSPENGWKTLPDRPMWGHSGTQRHMPSGHDTVLI